MEDFLSQISPQLGRTIGVIVFIGLTAWVISRGGQRAVERSNPADPERRQRIVTLWTAGRRIILVVLWLLAVLMAMSIWDIPITPLLAVGSAFALAVGFGAQEAVKDVIAGVLILAEGQFDIGDTIKAADVTGTVTDIRLRVTVLRDLSGTVHFIPNGQIHVSSNYTKGFARAVLDVGVAYDSDLAKVKGVLESELRAIETDYPELLVEPGEVLGVNELADSSIVVRAVLVTTADARWQVKRMALERIAKRFQTEGIEIPFQTLTVVGPGRSGENS